MRNYRVRGVPEASEANRVSGGVLRRRSVEKFLRLPRDRRISSFVEADEKSSVAARFNYFTRVDINLLINFLDRGASYKNSKRAEW